MLPSCAPLLSFAAKSGSQMSARLIDTSGKPCARISSAVPRENTPPTGNADSLARRLERVQIERRLLPRAAVEVDAADLRSVHAAAFVELQQRRQVAAAVAVGLDDHREIRAACRAHRAQDPLDEAEAVLQAPAVLVRAQIFLRIQKVREQIPVRVVDLHAVRTALLALFRREGKLLNQTVELFPSEILGVLRRRAVHALDALDAAVAELEEKFTAVPVHAVAGAAEKGLVRRLVQHGLARVGTLHLVDAEMAGDDKAHFVFRKLDERIRPERRHRTLFVRQMPVRRRADDAVFKLARAELCRGKQKAIIVSPYKIRSAMNIISGIVTGSSRFDCSTLLLAISGERS